jgi:hypothetical protein
VKAPWIHDEEWNQFMMNRYHISVDDQLDFIETLKLVTSLPSVVKHSIYDKLSATDY